MSRILEILAPAINLIPEVDKPIKKVSIFFQFHPLHFIQIYFQHFITLLSYPIKVIIFAKI